MLPVISPRGFRLDNAKKAYDIVLFSITVFMTVIMVLSFTTAMKPGQEMGDYIPALVGGLLVLLGNYLGKFPKNFFIGIRTPWTLASDSIWNQTHHMTGWLFMTAGLVVIFSSLFDAATWVFMSAIGIAALTPVVYSFWLYRREIGFKQSND